MDIAIVVKIIGIVFVFMGILYLLKPEVMKRLMEFFQKGRRIYFAGLIRFVLAIVFLLAANQCRHFGVILAFGIVFIISGVLVFTLGPARIRSMLDWYLKQPNLILRVIALIALGCGAIIIWAA